MYFLLIQLLLIIFYQNVFASIYNYTCTTTCNFPGMICVYGQCKCDWKIRLFWTGARCLLCPDNWAMSETSCIGFYGIKMTWMKAVVTCQNMHGDLISLRDNSILPLIYQVTNGNNRRKKRAQTDIDKTVAWTSAHAIQLTNLGLYQWNDNSLGNFDSRNNWWCKIGIAYLGYYHSFDEPTRLLHNNDAEKCVLFRRGKSSVPMLCLDDVFCDLEYPFVCERSESTAQRFFGPAPTYGGNTYSSNVVTSKTSTSSYAGNGGNYNNDENSNTNTEILPHPSALNSNKNRKTILIMLLIGLLLLAAVITGVFFFIKHRNVTGTQFHMGGSDIKGNQTSSNVRTSVISDANVSDINNEDQFPSHRTSAGEDGLTLGSGVSPGINISNQKQQKLRRGGYSKQHFDEFE